MQNQNQQLNSDKFHGYGNFLETGEVARRSSAHKFNVISNSIGAALSIIVVVVFGVMQENTTLIVLASLLSVWCLFKLIYSTFQLIISPYLRIFFDGASLQIHLTRRKTIIINPLDIQDMQQRPGSFFFAGFAFRQDGTVDIMVDNIVYSLRHIHISDIALSNLHEVKSYVRNTEKDIATEIKNSKNKKD